MAQDVWLLLENFSAGHLPLDLCILFHGFSMKQLLIFENGEQHPVLLALNAAIDIFQLVQHTFTWIYYILVVDG